VARAALDCGFPLATFIVRKEQKSYGRMNWIEGMPNSAPVALTDDLCNSSEALAHAHRIVLKEKLTPARHAFVLVNKFNARQHHAQRAHSDLYLPKDYRVHSLYTLDDIGLGGASH
jgi:orotate phosphoribosyltransferase